MKKMTLLEKAIQASKSPIKRYARPVTLEQKRLVTAYLCGEVEAKDVAAAIGKSSPGGYVSLLVQRAVRQMARDGELTIKLNGK